MGLPELPDLRHTLVDIASTTRIWREYETWTPAAYSFPGSVNHRKTRKKKHRLPNTRTHGLDLISRRSRAKMVRKCTKKCDARAKLFCLLNLCLFVCLFLTFSLPCSSDRKVPNNTRVPCTFGPDPGFQIFFVVIGFLFRKWNQLLESVSLN